MSDSASSPGGLRSPDYRTIWSDLSLTRGDRPFLSLPPLHLTGYQFGATRTIRLLVYPGTSLLQPPSFSQILLTTFSTRRCPTKHEAVEGPGSCARKNTGATRLPLTATWPGMAPRGRTHGRWSPCVASRVGQKRNADVTYSSWPIASLARAQISYTGTATPAFPLGGPSRVLKPRMFAVSEAQP